MRRIEKRRQQDPDDQVELDPLGGQGGDALRPFGAAENLRGLDDPAAA